MFNPKILGQTLIDDLTQAFKPGEWTAIIAKLKVLRAKDLAKTAMLLLPQLLLYYVLLSPIVAAPLYNLMLFHPSMTGPFYAHNITGVKIHNVTFASDNGKQLHSWYLKKTTSKFVVLISHGNGGNLTNRIPLIAMLLRQGLSVFIYDYQGYGRSQGSPSINNICKDGLAAYDYLVAKEGYNGKEIILFGESLGSGVTCNLAAKRTTAGIILQSPFSSLLALSKQKLFWLNLYPRWLFPSEQLDNTEILSHQHAPLLLLHGKKDKLISCKHSQEIYKTALPPKELVILPEAGHNDIYDRSNLQWEEAVRCFFTQQIKSPRKNNSWPSQACSPHKASKDNQEQARKANS